MEMEMQSSVRWSLSPFIRPPLPPPQFFEVSHQHTQDDFLRNILIKRINFYESILESP